MTFGYRHIVLSLLLSAIPFCLAARQSDGVYRGSIKVVPAVFEQRADSVYITLRYDLADVKVPSRLALELTPVLIGAERTEELPGLSVRGRNNYHISQRKGALMSDAERGHNTPHAILKGYGNRPERQAEYTAVIPFQAWMEGAHLNVREELAGCGRSVRILSVRGIADSIRRPVVARAAPYVVVPHVCYIRPQVEPVKLRQITQEAFIDFQVGKTDILPNYRNNVSELKKITDMQETLNDTIVTVTVRSITISGYASPEGSQQLNRDLSKRRAEALAGYLSRRFPYPESLYRVESGGENWDDLRSAVAGSDMPDKKELLYILDSIPAQIDYATDSSRKKSLMSYKGGDPYRYMLREFFPALRKAVCRIDYHVPGFDIEQAKAVFGKRPGDLSLEEMYRLAMTCEAGSAEFVKVFETAVGLYPDDPTANLNAASAALSRGDTVLAERYLDKAWPDTPEYDNAMGLLLLLKDDFDRAETYLERASEAGIEQADLNIGELKKRRGNMINNQ